MAVFYPAVVSEGSPRFVLPFFTNLTLYKDAEIRLRRREASARDAVAWTRKQEIDASASVSEPRHEVITTRASSRMMNR